MHHRRSAAFFFAGFLGLGPALSAPAALQPGDIVFIGYGATDPDQIAFVALANLAAGEVIRFTDNGWDSVANAFRTGEGGVTYTVPAGGLPAGSVVSKANPFTGGGWATDSGWAGTFALSTSGDQVLAFQGTNASPTFIAAINGGNAGWSNATSSNTSALPPGLVNGDTAITIAVNNGFYRTNVLNSGTPAQLRAAIGNAANWTTSATAVNFPGWSFVVTGGGGGPVAPVAFAGSNRTLQLSGPTLSITFDEATINDADGLAGVTYAWTPATGTGIVSWSARTGPVGTATDPANAAVTVNATGIYTFTLTATDPTSLTGSSSVTITVQTAPPPGNFDPPAAYYNPAKSPQAPTGQWLTGSALKSGLNVAINTGVRSPFPSYDSLRQSLSIYDQDPVTPSNVILAYTGLSVPGVWDSGVTWNREHMWPQSLQPTGNMLSDAHHLRTCNPSVNSSRGNKPYGNFNSNFWDPGALGGNDRGRAARAIFYCDVRYLGQVQVVDVAPNGPFPQAGSNTMGDKTTLLNWHYAFPVDSWERRRNQYIFSSVLNPTYWQGNRNPFIDYPELVWSIYGTGPNNSQLSVGTPAPDGSSSVAVNFGRRIVGAAIPADQSVTLTKTGSTPTTYNVTVSGDAQSTGAGNGQAFVGGGGGRPLNVRLAPSAFASAGNRSGTIVVTNTDLTSAGAGLGSADAADTVQVSATVLSPSAPSFDPVNVVASGSASASFAANSGVQSIPVNVYNASFTPLRALLNVNTVTGITGPFGVSTPLPITGVGATPASVVFTINTAGLSAGPYAQTATIGVADEAVPGSSSGTLSLQLNVTITGCSLQGDADGNGSVGANDLSIVLASFGSCPGDPSYDARANFDSNACVGANDLSIVLANFGRTCP
ncbi:MAG: endonuclease [Phycisphaerales bacterium]|nr:endonuclease [Phycisphaerales bacterium]